MQPITDDQFEEMKAMVQASEQAVQQTRVAEKEAHYRLGHARLWEQYEKQRQRIQGELDGAAKRAIHAKKLELQVGRLRLLRDLVASLTQVLNLQNALAAAEKAFRLLSGEQLNATARNKELTDTLAQIRKQ